jgi:hypothetical protein
MQINSMVRSQANLHTKTSDQTDCKLLSEKLEMKQAIRIEAMDCVLWGVLEIISMVIALQTGK